MTDRQLCKKAIEAIQFAYVPYSGYKVGAAFLLKDGTDSGRAFEKMKEWISAQGGDVSYLENPALFPVSAYQTEVRSPLDGYMTAMDAEKIGIAAVILGAGRANKEEPIDFSAGITILKKAGEQVKKGEPIAVLYTNRESALAEANKAYLDAVLISSKQPELHPLIYKVIG